MKINQSIRIPVVFLLIVFFCGMANADQKKPAWINQRPVEHDYYIGIGAADKGDGNLDYRQIAKENALQDISSEINVNITSQVIVNLMESSGAVQEDLKSQIRSTTKANLEGYELVDNWEDDNQYWVYYRLSKVLYAKNRKARIDKAAALGSNLFTKAKEKEADKDPAAALGLYVQALQSIQEFIAEPIKTEYAGSTIYLQNELFNRLQSLLSNITLAVEPKQIDGTAGRAIKDPVKITAMTNDGSPVANLPLLLQFVKGAGEMITQVRTANDGIANARITNITSPDKMQIVNIKVIVASEVTQNEYPLIYNLLKNLAIPSARIIINVGGISCFMESSESIIGEIPEMLYVEPKLKKILTDKGFSFTDNIADADILIKVEALAREGAQVYNLFSSFADLSISVTNLENGQEVYKNSFSGIKGIQLDYKKAAIEALKNAGKKMDEISSELISKLH
ncbi:MAG: LPP20 family lipoprotein [Calditrichaceae bacterium]|nr:LPP20 family lipoprotein [Calditrichaceae bacterium]